MAAVTSPETTPQPRVYFQTPPGTEEEVPQKQGRVTVKYDRKELRRRLNLEEWIVSQLMNLYDCEVGQKTNTVIALIAWNPLLQGMTALSSRRS